MNTRASVETFHHVWSTRPSTNEFAIDAWRNRAKLNTVQREGLNNILFLLACTHVENVLPYALSARISSVRNLALVPLPPTNSTDPFDENLEPAGDLACRLCDRILADLQKRPISKLKEAFNDYFPRPLSQVLDTCALEDVAALEELRNIVAHGKMFTWTTDWNGQNMPIPDLAAKAHFPGSNLAKVMRSKNVALWKGHCAATFFEALASDATVSYFFRVANEFEKKVVMELTPLERECVKQNLQLLPSFD